MVSWGMRNLILPWTRIPLFAVVFPWVAMYFARAPFSFHKIASVKLKSAFVSERLITQDAAQIYRHIHVPRLGGASIIATELSSRAPRLMARDGGCAQ